MQSPSILKSELGFTLSAEQCELILREAVTLLSDCGMQCRSARAADVIAQSFRGTVHTGDRIRFSPREIDAFVSDYRKHTAAAKSAGFSRPQAAHAPASSPDKQAVEGKGDIRLAPSGYGTPAQPSGTDTELFSMDQSWSCLNLADTRKGVLRTADEDDLVRIVRFLDAYGVKGAVSPVVLAGFPVQIRDLKAVQICLKNSPVYGAPTHTPGPEELGYYREMAAVTGRPIPILAMTVNSPMRYDDHVLEFALEHRESREIELQLTGGLPSAGSTSPIVFPASYIQATAESLASSLFAYACSGIFLEPYLRNDPFDMRYGNYTVAGPLFALHDLFGRALTEYITGAKRGWGYFLSMSSWPDQQAAHERTVSCWLQALAGARTFHGSGQLCSDEVYSPEQVVIDREILAGCERFIRGLEWSNDVAAARTLLQEGFERGQFLDHESTFTGFRSWYHDSALFPARNLGQWRETDRDPLARARSIVDEYVGKNEYSPSKEAARELDSIYASAERRLLQR